MGRSIAVIAGLVVAILALSWWCGQRHQPLMEADITARSSLALTAAGLDDVTVLVRAGRDVVLSGSISSEAQMNDARAAANVYGARRIVNQLEVITPPRVTESDVGARAAADIARVNQLDAVQFEIGSATLTPRDRAILDEATEILAQWPGVEVEISGHTDSTGPDRLNLDLSVRRAQAVRAYLGRTLDVGRFQVVGYGAEQPVADNASPKGRERNRRIEFRVLGDER